MNQLHVAIQMDPIESIDIKGDTSFRLALEAQRRNHYVSIYQPKDLSWSKEGVQAITKSVRLKDEIGNHFKIEETKNTLLKYFDVILMRQDPPFDMAYITSTHLLEHLPKTTQVINNPKEVRNAPEKILITNFPDLIPPTLISNNKEQITKFRKEHKDIIIKPLYGNGGAEVFHLKPEDENLGSLLDMFFAKYREPIITQKYLPEIRNGDKRIILVDGEPVGGVMRVPVEGDSRANFHAGGGAQKTTLTDREREICSMIGPTLSKLGLLFVGIDVIGDYLTEINVTSPTGIQEINRLDDIHIEKLLWDAIEAQLDARQLAY